MTASNKKYYVVWRGSETGVYSTWTACEAATKGVKGAKFMGFQSLSAAQRAFEEGAEAHWGKGKARPKRRAARATVKGDPIPGSLCVDAAWNSVSKLMEYRGVWLDDGRVAFAEGPFEDATNNIGEFLAVVQALEYLHDLGSNAAVYTDSRTALSWVRKLSVRSESIKLGRTSREVELLVRAALAWLKRHPGHNQVLKWETRAWGNVPADYGRK